MDITDKKWEKWRARDPYCGVVSLNEFRKSNLMKTPGRHSSNQDMIMSKRFWLKFDHSSMQMNAYNLNLLVTKLEAHGARKMFVEFTNHNNYLGVLIYFKKP